VVPQAGGEWGLTVKRHERTFFMVMVMVAQLCKFTKKPSIWAGCGGTHLLSQHLGGEGRRTESSRPA
jgi:hypothetical protein